MVLSARPSHGKTPQTSIQQRWEMLCVACGNSRQLLPDNREMLLERPSYTVETLVDLRADCPREALVWVIGSDAYTLLPTWYQWRRVLELAHLVVLKRPGHPLDLDPLMQVLTEQRRVTGLQDTQELAGHVLVLDNPMQEVSAEGIRKTIALGGNADDLLPAGVATYIRQHGLYGE